MKIRWFALKIWFDNHEINFQDRREGFMKNASWVIFFCLVQKKFTIFQSGKFVQPPTRSLYSPYTKHGIPHFHLKHRLNRLPHEYIHTWLSLATLSVHVMKLLPNHDPFQKWHFTIMTTVYCMARRWLTTYGLSTLHATFSCGLMQDGKVMPIPT
jgi:hypothetical protein